MTTTDLEVPVATLRHAAEVLLQHLESVTGSTIRLDTDYFWAIPREQRNDPCSRPSELTIGQLTESLDNVERMVRTTTRHSRMGWCGFRTSCVQWVKRWCAECPADRGATPCAHSWRGVVT